MPLGYRARRILFATVTEYVALGTPVSSRRLARRYDLELSAASIRNVLGDLEEEGYLVQPHTSSGRIPTDRGFRAFVDALVQVGDVGPKDQQAILARLSTLRPGEDDIALEASRLLSSLTGTAAILKQPRPNEEHLVQLRFIPLKEQELLAVLVSGSGAVENRVVRVRHTPSDSELEQIHNYLAERLEQRSLGQLRDMVAAEAETMRGRYVALGNLARDMVEATVSAGATGAAEQVVIEGHGRLLEQPDFEDVDKIRGVMQALDEKERLLHLLEQTLCTDGVQVLIGAENRLTEESPLSVIAASYSRAGARTGSLGLIAPTRLDYQKVVPMVGFAARVVSAMCDPDKDETRFSMTTEEPEN